MKYQIGFSTDPGPRDENQDAVLIFLREAGEMAALLIVSDGMGGANAGAEASRLAVSVIHEHLTHQDLPGPRDAEARLTEAIKAANLAIYDRSQTGPETQGMGCTVVVALAIDDSLWVAHVGDSRAYLIRNSRALQLTEDHSWISTQIRTGRMTEAQAESLHLGHVLDRALGIEENVQIDIWSDDLLDEGDTLVLCTDGLYGALSIDDIIELVDEHSAQEAAGLLVQQAVSAGAADNLSLALLQVRSAEEDDDEDDALPGLVISSAGGAGGPSETAHDGANEPPAADDTITDANGEPAVEDETGTE